MTTETCECGCSKEPAPEAAEPCTCGCAAKEAEEKASK